MLFCPAGGFSMRIDVRNLFLVTLFAVFLTACKAVTVTNPVGGEVYTTPPDIALSFTKGQPATLKITLNDQDITSLFVIQAEGALAAGASIADYLVDGENFLRVVTPATPTVKFLYDAAGPVVHITQVTEGSTLVVRGYAEDPSGVQSVQVNGSAVSLNASNQFEAQVANANFITFTATDRIGRVRVQKFARPTVSVANSLSVRVSSAGLNFIKGELESLLKTSALGGLLKGMNPLKEECILGSCYRINVNDATIADNKLNLAVKNSADGRLDVSGTLSGFWADAEVRLDPLIGWTTRIPVAASVDKITFSTTAKVSVGAGNQLKVSLENLSLSLGKLSADVSILPSWLVDPFLNAFKGIVVWILEGQLKAILPAKMAEMVDTFPRNIVIDINGNQISPEILPASIATPENGLVIGLGARINAITHKGPAIVGYPWKEIAAVPAASNVSPKGAVRDIGIVISQNMINQALAAVTTSGMLTVSMTDKDIPGLKDINGAGSAESVRVRLNAASAPSLELVKSSRGLATFRMHDVYLGLDAAIDKKGTMRTVMGATVDIEATANLGMTDQNALSVEFAGSPRIKIRAMDPASTLVLGNNLAQSFINELTPKVVPVVLGMIGAIPLPSFEGYNLSVGEIWVTDESANYIGLVASMIRAQGKAARAAPHLSAYVENGTTASVSGVRSARAANAVTVEGNVVTIALNGYNPDLAAGDLQYRYRVDGAPFSVWRERESIELYGLNAGLHTIEICARTAQLVPSDECATVHVQIKGS
ncbi:hypothetical protein HDN1F_37620 [gamma proteobacterium HdN1]|nr:hypothetical protein HDN1F_37620 [gamma proteobacterium HdN1]